MDDMTNEERPPLNCRLLVTAAGSIVTCHRTGSPCSAMCPHMNAWDGGGLFSCADPELEGSPVLMVYNDDLAYPWKAPRFAEALSRDWARLRWRLPLAFAGATQPRLWLQPPKHPRKSARKRFEKTGARRSAAASLAARLEARIHPLL